MSSFADGRRSTGGPAFSGAAEGRDGLLRLRRKVAAQLNPDEGLTATTAVLVVLILLATAAAVLVTEPAIAAGRETFFKSLEIGFAVVFTVEYALRLWSAPDAGMTRKGFALSAAGIIDLVAVVGTLLPFVAGSPMMLRLLRLFRLARIAKLGRYSRAVAVTERAIRSRSSQLLVGVVLFLLFMLFGATLMSAIEGGVQPQEFGSIPRAMWWTVATMTTVGYGDVVPLTPLGKLLGGFIAIGGIMLIAIPTGIMAAAFSDELTKGDSRQA